MDNNNNLFYISPDEAEKDDDGDVIMTDYVTEKTNITCIIDGDTTSVSTRDENNEYDDEYGDEYDGEYGDEYDDEYGDEYDDEYGDYSY